MDARKILLGVVCLGASGAMLSWAGVPGGRFLLGLAGLGFVGPVANEVRDLTTDGRQV